MEGIANPRINDFQTVCDACDGICDVEIACDYWMHETRYYGNSILQQSYCTNCIIAFPLYDGREEYVCQKCKKYVDVFISSKDFLVIMLHIKNNSLASEKLTLKQFLYEYDENLPDKVQIFFDFLRNFHEKDRVEQLKDIDLKFVREWTIKNI